jgi:hypothetical protein
VGIDVRRWALGAALGAAALATGVARAAEPEPVAPAATSASPGASAAQAELLDAVAEEDRGWRWEEMRFFTAFMYQDGHGLQSQAGPVNGRNRETMWVLEPMMQLRVRQNDELVHELTVPVDIVSAASTDAVDVVSKASEYNEAATIDLTSTYSPNDVVDMSFRFGFHYEEPMRSFLGGPSLAFHLLEDNTVIGLNMLVVSDGFDPHMANGKDVGFAARTSFGFNATLLQVLSETTLLDASFGTTEQWGTLETTWNSVIAFRRPTKDDVRPATRINEKFPKSRNRNAFFARLSQISPGSGTTGKVGYRFYFDENGSLAHTLEAQLYQYFAPFLYVRAHGRLHTQTAPDFWMPFVIEPYEESLKRTSDSDLEDLIAREVGVRIVLLRSQAPASFRAPDEFSLEYLRYQRDNDLHIDFGSFGYARSF